MAGSDVLVVGGGLAGLSAAAALGAAGFTVELLERRPLLGGRATSWEIPGTEETIDNCQHVLLGCCTNLMDFYRRLGVAAKIRWYGSIAFRTPDARESVVAATLLPAPLHLAPSLFAFHAFGWSDRWAITRGMLVDPVICHHGVDADEWQHRLPADNYVLWNKARADSVSNPDDLNNLAQLMPRTRFISTLGAPAPNVELMGVVGYAQMKPLVQQAGVYLATARET